MSGIRIEGYYHCVHGGGMIIVAFGCVMMGAITLLTRSYTSCVKFYSYQYYIYAHSNFPALPSPLSFSFKKKTEPWTMASHMTYFFGGYYIVTILRRS